MPSSSKCARPACTCKTVSGSQYCSEVCADAKGMAELVCQCQHPDCGGETLKP